MQAAIKNGNVSKAAQYLESLPLAETTAAVHQQMRDLHPSEAPPVAAEVEAAPIQLDMEDLEAILALPRRNKAPGPSGWTYEHIQQLCHTPEGKTACLALLNALLAGSLPGYAELLDSDGLPLLKPNGGIRPIAIGET